MLFKSATLFIARLTEVEKSRIRGAINEDRLDWIFQNKHAIELAGSDKIKRATFDEAVKLVNEAYTLNSQSNVFGRTWAF